MVVESHGRSVFVAAHDVAIGELDSLSEQRAAAAPIATLGF
jgi:hypothetical protein